MTDATTQLEIEEVSASPTKPEAAFDNFLALDFRVGRVIAVTEPAWSRKLLEFSVDFGSEIGTKTVFSGVKAWYAEADFLNKCFPFIVNFPERKMGEGVSQGMMVMVDAPEKPILMPLSNEVTPGQPLA